MSLVKKTFAKQLASKNDLVLKLPDAKKQDRKHKQQSIKAYGRRKLSDCHSDDPGKCELFTAGKGRVVSLNLSNCGEV